MGFCRHDYQSKLAGFFTITYLCNPNPSSWWDWHDLLLSTISCSPSPFSKWDSSQTECFCWRWLGHWWGRCWSSTSHLCRPSSRQRRCMFQVCTTVCALCKNLSSVYTHQLAAISVYTSPCLHPPLCKPSAVTTSSIYTHLCKPSAVNPAQFTPTTVEAECSYIQLSLHPALCNSSSDYTHPCLHPTHSVYSFVYTHHCLHHLCLHPGLFTPNSFCLHHCLHPSLFTPISVNTQCWWGLCVECSTVFHCLWWLNLQCSRLIEVVSPLLVVVQW